MSKSVYYTNIIVHNYNNNIRKLIPNIPCLFGAFYPEAIDYSQKECYNENGSI